MSQPLSGTNPLFNEQEAGIVEDENGGGRTIAIASEQVQQNQKEGNESEHEQPTSQQCSGGAADDTAIDLNIGREGEDTANLGDVNQMRDERQREEKGDASVSSLASSLSPRSPPAEDTHIMITEEQDTEDTHYLLITEEQDTASEKTQRKELTEEEKGKTQTIVEDLYEELIEEKTGGCCRGCCHLCCWGCCVALTFSFNDCHQEVFTLALKKAAGSGLKMFRRLVWPLAPALLRDVWVSLEWILGLLALILSIVQFAVTGGGEIFNIIHLALVAFGFLLASIDALVQLTELKSCKECYHLFRGNREGKNRDKESDNLCCCCCSRSTRGRKALLAVKNVFDIDRIFLSELILYPLLLCDLFELILHKGWEFENVNETIGFFLFLLSLGSLVLFVYILRTILLFIVLARAQKTRQRLVDKVQQKPPPYQDNEVINRTAGKWFSSYFFMHVVFQMIVQILMIIAISAKFQYENRNYDKDNTIHISGYLWYMIIAGYILPFCGFLTFFIVNFYWVREFPIKLYIQFLSVLRSPDASSLFFPKEKDGKGGEEEQEGLIAKWREVMRHVNTIDLIKDYKKMVEQKFVVHKLGFPFCSPGLILLCVIYGGLQLTFLVCATQNDAGDDVILNEGGWTIFYICNIILGSLANMYTYAVACLWLFIVALIFAIIAFIIAIIAFIIALIIAAIAFIIAFSIPISIIVCIRSFCAYLYQDIN